MSHGRRVAAAVAGTVVLFVLVQVGALALVGPFTTMDYQAVEDPSDPTNSFLYVGLILVATAVMLGAMRFEKGWLLRVLLVATSGLLGYYVASVLVPPVAAAAFGLVLAVALWVYPEWYVIDAAGAVMGAGMAGLFGISFGLLPAVVLLSVLAVYDAISVYGTEHMLALAEGALDMNVPVVLVIPTTFDYSFLDDSPAATRDGAESDDATGPGDDATAGDRTAVANGDGRDAPDDAPDRPSDADDAPVDQGPMERDALFIGLGDAVMPTIMVASAARFLPEATGVANYDLPLIALNLPALTAMAGTFAGLFALLWLVLKGRAHAGLPLLNGGAIGGYLVGALASGVPLATALGL